MIEPESPEFHALIATLRPGDALECFEELLKTARRVVPQVNRYEWRGYQLTLSPDGQILESAYGSDFPADVPIEGLYRRMSITEARKAQPALRYLGPQSWAWDEGYDLVPAGTAWDLLVNEGGGRILRLMAVPKGGADDRAAWAKQTLEATAKRWHDVQERDRWATIDSPDALLDAWLASEDAAAPWSDYPRNINSAYADWLRQARPDELHEAARGHNWSYSPAPLFYISRRSDCDLATALHILYAADPYEFAKKNFDPARIKDHRMLRLVLGIRDRVLSGLYRRSELALDFSPYWTPPQVGPEFPVKLAGRRPEPVAIDDGYPVAVWESLGTKSRAPDF